jgi:ABC-type sugar transport system ATPase subunit
VSVKDVVLGIRPEHVHPLNGSFCDEQQMKVTSIVKSYEMLGSEFLIHTGEGNYQLKFRQNNDGDTPQIGREVQLVFAMAAVHLFDGSTGQRLN